MVSGPTLIKLHKQLDACMCCKNMIFLKLSTQVWTNLLIKLPGALKVTPRYIQYVYMQYVHIHHANVYTHRHEGVNHSLLLHHMCIL
jgi:hypothetical protein